MRYLIVILFISFLSCNKAPKKKVIVTNVNVSDKDDAKKAVIHSYEFINTKDLSDSLTFNHYRTFFLDSFVLVPSEGKNLSDKETILEEWRGIFKENKGTFDLTINRVEMSVDLAYVLYNYNEKLTSFQSGKVIFDVVQSAIAVLRKATDGSWKFETLKWN